MINFILKITYFIIIIILNENIVYGQTQGDIYQNHIIWSICGSPGIYLETDKYWETYQKIRYQCEKDVMKNSPTIGELKTLCSTYKNIRVISSNLNFKESDLCKFANKN